MARTDNLTNYLTDVASAIKEKKGDLDTPIPANTFDEEIRNLPSGGGGDIEEYISSTSDSIDTNDDYCSKQIMSRIKKMPALDLSNVNSENVLRYLFENLTEITEIPEIKIKEELERINLISVVKNCNKITNLNNLANAIKNKKIIDMTASFAKCSKLTDVSFLEELNTSDVTDMHQIFYLAESIKTVPLFDTQNVKNANEAFLGCSELTTIPSFNLAKCSRFNRFLSGTTQLESIPKLNLSSATEIPDIIATKHNLLTDLGGFENLGFSYTQKTANYNNYTLDLSTCPNLTKESLLNVINGLYDLNKTYAGDPTEYTQKLVLGATNMAKLEPEEIAIATQKGWTVS